MTQDPDRITLSPEGLQGQSWKVSDPKDSQLLPWGKVWDGQKINASLCDLRGGIISFVRFFEQCTLLLFRAKIQ